MAVYCDSSSGEIAGICLDSVASQSSPIKRQAPDQRLTVSQKNKCAAFEEQQWKLSSDFHTHECVPENS